MKIGQKSSVLLLIWPNFNPLHETDAAKTGGDTIFRNGSGNAVTSVHV